MGWAGNINLLISQYLCSRGLIGVDEVKCNLVAAPRLNLTVDPVSRPLQHVVLEFWIWQFPFFCISQLFFHSHHNLPIWLKPSHLLFSHFSLLSFLCFRYLFIFPPQFASQPLGSTPLAHQMSISDKMQS